MIHIDVHQEKGERRRILQTTERTQLVTMTLPPGGTFYEEEGFVSSDQVIYVVEGRIELEVEGEKREMRAGEVALIPAATSYRFRVVGRRSTTLFNVFGPPAYPAETRESLHEPRQYGMGREEY
jgi:mannose-6-phosphate isomerase-like protein (cupin superfamily)